MDPAQSSRVYFPGLNGIRAIAACSVMLSHVLLALHHFPGHARHEGMDLANHGVIIFFTLSGFLITYLLLEEKTQFGSVDFRGFYLRRILRIWPLYFLYIALAMLFHWRFSADGVENAPFVVLFILFVPNIAFNLGRYMPDTAPLWSIGIEEQFYAVWPLVISRVRALRAFLLGLIVVLVGARVALHVTLGSGKHLATSVVDSLGYDSMAIGALFAILYRARDPWLMKIASTIAPRLAFVALIVLHALNMLRPLSLLGPLVTSMLTGLFIVSQVTGRTRLFDLERPSLNFIGRVSFGVYVYHMLIITILVKVSAKVVPDAVLPAPVILSLVAVLTIATAALSYRYVEMPFLRLKDRFARIKSSSANPRES